MKETLYNAKSKDQTRIKRAFKWVITFRDFPKDSWQTVDGDSMMSEALTFFTKGRAEFFLDGVKRGDRVPGILSSEHGIVGSGGEFKIVYVEPTTRVCIPAAINYQRLPRVTKHVLTEGETVSLKGAFLVCLGKVSCKDKEISEERTFRLAEHSDVTALAETFLLEFHDPS